MNRFLEDQENVKSTLIIFIKFDQILLVLLFRKNLVPRKIEEFFTHSMERKV